MTISAATLSTQKSYIVIGLMSGTSLDGLDIACCRFSFHEQKQNYEYQILVADTIEYTNEWKNIFLKLEQADALFFSEWDRRIGCYFGEEVKKFVDEYKIENVDFIASHGHTIFHRPDIGFTVQAGHGASVAAAAQLPVICDFRSLDVALGGQGAPLVPIGDRILFSDYDYCLNLGGIANISYVQNGKTIAFDICPVNMVLNFYAQKKGREYDENGELASLGVRHDELLKKLNQLDFYSKTPPKSLGKEWVVAEFLSITELYNINIEDKLATLVEHIAFQISKVVLEGNVNSKTKNIPKLLVTGGGAFNSFLVGAISSRLYGQCDVIIPDEKTVKFKEALIFALLGVLRWQNQINSLGSVTGAAKDSSGGAIYYL